VSLSLGILSSFLEQNDTKIANSLLWVKSLPISTEFYIGHKFVVLVFELSV